MNRKTRLFLKRHDDVLVFMLIAVFVSMFLLPLWVFVIIST